MELASEQTPQRGSLLGVLFDVASPIACGGPSALFSIWTAGAMNRANNMCQLAMLLEYQRWNGSPYKGSLHGELACAHQLASNVRALKIRYENAVGQATITSTYVCEATAIAPLSAIASEADFGG